MAKLDALRKSSLDRAKYISMCQQLVEAFMTAGRKADEVSKAREAFDGHSFDYFHRGDIEAAERAAEQAGELLAEVIDEKCGELIEGMCEKLEKLLEIERDSLGKT